MREYFSFHIEMLSKITPEYREIAKIYSEETPSFLVPFFDSPALSRLQFIGQNCGTEYGNFHHYLANFSRLDHSLGVALIAWNFSKDRKLALAGLFHDMAHTVFSHVGDFLFGDPENQETAEKGLYKILESDSVIPRELAKLGITLDEVVDYSMYPLLDNKSPKLSCDRLEYTFSSGFALRNISLDAIRASYSHIEKIENEDEKIAFNDKNFALEFANLALKNDIKCFSSYEESAMMHFLARILSYFVSKGLLTYEMLYSLKDSDIISMIELSDDENIRELWDFYQKFSSYRVHRFQPETNLFCVSSKIKRRYINPLFIENGALKRVSEEFQDFAKARDYHLSRQEEWITVDHEDFHF